ncbi:hypothetical protein [Streptomyces sp. NBC_00847]|uniref:hypothetical protein n=1 Tax=Streptomyces sp. NBC_00847 TaxID=2975850 RepID=UPI00225DF412|nr:hypothetical protein [Streptomyces sp. NBC_00847]MCX4885912.1 hypothetical protein [Streptomyces sp. NBC_00847]
MKVRADKDEISALLREGHSDTYIGAQLGIHRRHISKARTALGIPRVPGGRKPASTPQDFFWQRTQPDSDGHTLWTGYRNNNGIPVYRHKGRLWCARRVAFTICYGREPEGRVRPGCDVDACVEPAHMEDRIVRHRTADVYAAIFGDAG